MDSKDFEFLNRLKATFVVEAAEHVQAISKGIIELEKETSQERQVEVIETAFREAHSLKGAARTVGLKDIESVCHSLEDAFAALKKRAIVSSPALCDLLYQAVDAIARLVSSTDSAGAEPDRAHERELIRKLAAASVAVPLREGSGSEEEAGRVQEKSEPWYSSAGRDVLQASSFRIPASRLDSLLLQAEEMIQIKMMAGQRASEARGIKRMLMSRRGESPSLPDRIGEGVSSLAEALERDHRSIKRMVDEHLESAKRMTMLPVASLMEPFPKMIRDLAREQGKQIDLVIRGDEIEADRRILEEVKDPLIHLVRNCIDHGILPPDERAVRNKASKGTITVSFAAMDSRRMEILVSDDGEGVDIEQVRAAAVDSGIISEEAAKAMDPDEALVLVFRSGITTSPRITEISGRGLGLTIVREKVERLGGTVFVDTRAHEGTTFRLVLPLTLATFRGVLVRAGGHLFVLPTANAERALRVEREAIGNLGNRDMIQTDRKALPLVRLCDVLNYPPSHGTVSPGKSGSDGVVDHIPAVVMGFAGTRMAFQVDEILDERQVILKDLGKQLRRVRNILGATVLGDGALALVLNVSDLMKSALDAASAAPPRIAAAQAPARKKSVLIADDSITARTLLKNILETAGYQVATAVDGADAFAKARDGEFDLVASDVDMPRMNGFELTASIRSDGRLKHVPVVLVTALESREDRERGMDAGANAYIVKRGFDQGNLLEIIGRLI
jgi:two-component system chemotaxis sensor kinase CheA